MGTACSRCCASSSAGTPSGGRRDVPSDLEPPVRRLRRNRRPHAPQAAECPVPAQPPQRRGRRGAGRCPLPLDGRPIPDLGEGGPAGAGVSRRGGPPLVRGSPLLPGPGRAAGGRGGATGADRNPGEATPSTRSSRPVPRDPAKCDVGGRRADRAKRPSPKPRLDAACGRKALRAGPGLGPGRGWWNP